jgi:geranyl-CoA carboxylase alpha subunit
VTSIRVSPDQAVNRGDVLGVLEAMKMEHQIVAPISGTLAAVAVTAGQQVGARDILFVIKGEPA